ncbi:hypothetical protein FIBSPDRAFT_949295 [Athelia psychrophila]|uniref:Uncharacterized protein n=1 Tax=Athelia psychrophila TaxID=1759441 RepID=A0A166PSS5_9AGAM|nr:hypothetical protein FIBSPDRAFT_949295 [Fibularhizoctonia sp. CBS 109695]
MIEPILSAIPANTMCTDIDRCRTLIQIIRSSVIALLAATYLSVHVNISRPNLPWYWKALDRAKIFLVALIFPDWIFMWAVRSFIVARRVRTILEDARKLAEDAWANTEHPPPAWENRWRMFIRYEAGKYLNKYTITHAFYVTMGGLHFYNADGTPVGPLDVPTAYTLIRDGNLLLPSLERIESIAKSTKRGKAFAVLGLVVFLLKCVIRFRNGLPLADFEIMVFAHSSIAVCTFLPWWYKPMDVEETMRVSSYFAQRGVARGPGMFPVRPMWEVAYAYIFGNQDSLYQLSRLEGVPTFWSGEPSSIFDNPQVDQPPPEALRPAFFLSSICGLPLIAIFGVIHWQAANSSVLANETEQKLWTCSAIAITFVPLAIILAWFLCWIPICLGNSEWPNHILRWVGVAGSTIYIVARIVLLVVACLSLGHLPTPVYETLGGNWNAFLQW